MRLLSRREMSGWESSVGKCPCKDFFGWQIPGGKLLLGGNCPCGGAIHVGKRRGELSRENSPKKRFIHYNL